MKDVIYVALEGYDLILGLKIDKADRALVTERHHLLAISVFLEIFDFLKLLLASLGEACFEFEQNASHTHGIDPQINRLTSELLNCIHLSILLLILPICARLILLILLLILLSFFVILLIFNDHG